MENIFPLIFKETDYQSFIKVFTENSFDEKKDSTEEGAVFCTLCRNKITDIKETAIINSSHRHTFVNPDGIKYSIRCFKNAPGALPVTEPVKIYTWFPGYSWRVTQCSLCRTHNGWKYSSGNDEFYGLIEEMIIYGV
jgi:hypothetical protein